MKKLKCWPPDNQKEKSLVPISEPGASVTLPHQFFKKQQAPNKTLLGAC
jgi:hypothetical protein